MKLSFDFKKIITSHRGQGKRGEINPDRDWKMLFMTFLVFLLFILLIAGFNLWKINQGEFFNAGSEIGAPQDPVNKEELRTVLDRFEQKAERFGEYRTNPPETADPSI